MRRVVLRQLGRLIVRRPGAIAVLLGLLTIVSVWRVSALEINHNQLDLIPQDLPSVQATLEMIDIRGGVGFLLILLRSDDLDHMKRVADDLSERLEALEEIRYVRFTQDVGFVQQRIGLYIESDDMKEAYKRIRKKIKSVLRKANPFFVELRKSKEVELDLTDLIDKYRAMNKKVIDDPYYVDIKKEVLLLVVKPMGGATDMAFTGGMMKKIEALIVEYNANNTRDAKLIEDYVGNSDGATVTYGYTGTYKRNLDDSETIAAALVPTSGVAFVGILLYLLFFLRRPSQIALIMTTLVASVIMSFAFCELVIGELNTITAILGAILMGIGIDFGIHFIYRLREEYTLTGELVPSIKTTIEQSGSASLTSALTTGAALFVLALSDFKGFSHFGIIAGAGVLITAAMMYTALPVAYLLLDRVWPGFKNNLLRAPKKGGKGRFAEAGAYPYAKQILIGTVGLSIVLAFFAWGVDFDYDSRHLMAADRPSILLQDEINDRFQISSDPVGIHTESLEATKKLYNHFMPLAKDSTIDAVVSLFRVVPSDEQQQTNRKILDKLQKLIEPITPDMLDEDQLDKFEKLTPYLEAQPFGIDELPDHIMEQFKPVPGSSYTGFVTFIYPKVTLWDGKELIQFAEEVSATTIDGKTYYAAGMAVLFADLATIVLEDGKNLTGLAALVIFLIIVISFRSLRAALFSMLPLAAGMIWMLGLMCLTGWRINFMNIVVFPVVFGYGISSGVHLYYRFIESGSVMVAVKRTGAAVAASSITTLVGWAALLVSNHRGLESMGILACLGIASALTVSLTVLPAILQVWQNWSERRGKTTAATDAA